MRRTSLLKIMGLTHQEEEEEMKQKRKEEVKLPPLHLRIPPLGQ